MLGISHCYGDGENALKDGLRIFLRTRASTIGIGFNGRKW
jgi:hypothetical protein